MNDTRLVPALLEGASRAPAADGASPWPAVAVGRRLERARAEWLHTNGAGAYASSTVAGMHTRRYHGLLVAALDPPHGRHVFLSHVDVTATLARGMGMDAPPPSRRPGVSLSRSGRPKWELAVHQFPSVDPAARPFHLERFDQDPLPRWTYGVAGGELEITLGLVRGENAVVLRYAFRGGDERIMLALRPLLAARDYHGLLRENGAMIQRVELRAGEVRVQPRRELPRVCFRFEGTFVGSQDWWRHFEYLAERDRGLDYEEDLWTPGLFEVSLDGGPRYLVASIDKLPTAEPEALLEAARAAILAEDPGPAASPLARRLTVAAEAFRADLAPRPGVVAGYPWIERRGRATLVALPGLYLVPGKIDGAIRILRETMAATADGRGLDADAGLWLFEAARHVAAVLGDEHPFVTGELLPALRETFESSLQGTREGVGVTPEGLFAARRGGDALTWMDARVDGRAVTPRAGCPVELTALWARGCDTLARLARAASDLPLSDRAAAERDRARRAFKARFWCAGTGYPYDVVPGTPHAPPIPDGDASVRANAVLALSVDPDCFTPEQADAVLARARRDLVTPAGLRTLAPSEADYAGRYAGDVAAREGAYHQGTVWPWLLGAYVRAALHRGADRRELEALVASAAANALALGQVPEIADGDPPHAPGGCVAQAWSVAELLRAAVWDLGGRSRRSG
jgi:predicted glycogen debranching enzyme